MNASEKANQELRTKDRVDVSREIRVIDRQSGCDIGRLVNISEEGLMLMGSTAIPENNILQLSLAFENAPDGAEPIQIGVESLWGHAANDQTQFWTGFHIIDISDQDLDRIRQLIKE